MFYIVENSVPIVRSGTLGQMFLKLHNSIINVARNTITLQGVTKIPPRVE